MLERIISSVFILLLLSITLQYANGQNTSSSSSESNSGLNYSNICEDTKLCHQLGIQWWKWVYTIPSQLNPAADEDGTLCGLNQTGKVWNLAGSFDGNKKFDDRHCTITSEKVIFFPIYNSFCSPAEEPTLLTDQDMKNCAALQQSQGIGFEATLKKLDTNEQVVLPYITVVTEAFNFWIPDDNNFGAESGEIRGAGNGAYVGIGSLEPGEYELHFKGLDSEPYPQKFDQDVTYKLIIIPPDTS